MPIVPGLTETAKADHPYYRMTALSFRTTNATHHCKVVNGEGAIKSRHGARYNYPGVRTVYLAEDLTTCLAEKMFYFQREILAGLDTTHITGLFPPFQQTFVLWEVLLKSPVHNLFDLSLANAAAMNIFPCMMLNPSQDYYHLKDRRSAAENAGYRGLRAPSTRVLRAGNMLALFDDQSKNLKSITPFEIEFRLITPAFRGQPSLPFTNHAVQRLDRNSGEVRIIPHPSVGLPNAGLAFQNWTKVEFNH